MKKFLLAVLLTALSISTYSANKETICKILSNNICDSYSCYILSQKESGRFYFVTLKCPSLWEGDPGFAIAEINQVLNKYSDLVTMQAFSTNESGDLEKIMQYEDLRIHVHYLTDTNAVIISAYNLETEQPTEQTTE